MPHSAGRTILAWVTGAVLLVGAGALVGAYIAGRPSGEALALQIRTERAAHAHQQSDQRIERVDCHEGRQALAGTRVQPQHSARDNA